MKEGEKRLKIEAETSDKEDSGQGRCAQRAPRQNVKL